MWIDFDAAEDSISVRKDISVYIGNLSKRVLIPRQIWR